MHRFRWQLLVIGICLPLALLAYGVRIPGLSSINYAVAIPVPEGDQEVAWFNTTTSASTWERFIAGAHRARVLLPGLQVDDSHAFLDQTTAVPEVVLSVPGRNRLRVRWYKLNSTHGPGYWTSVLAKRTPAPLAIIGGGSSDRARDMALALSRQTEWKGDRPLFLITNATAETVYTDTDLAANPTHTGQMVQLLKIYDGRSFRFCFSNRQMAEAMLDFVWRSPDLRPHRFDVRLAKAVGSGLLSFESLKHRPGIYYVEWNDDPYSGDLVDLVKQELPRVLASNQIAGLPVFSGWQVPFSVGGFYSPNRAEREVAERLIAEIAKQKPQRSLLVIPTVTSPARRLIRTLAAADPTIGEKLIAINGDGMSANTILRDGDIAWPIHALPIPILLFTHHNPMGWDESQENQSSPSTINYSDLSPPNSTEDVLHYADLVKTLMIAAFGLKTDDQDDTPVSGRLVSRADELMQRFRSQKPSFFDELGNRAGGTGEYVLLVSPRYEVTSEIGSRFQARVEVWRRAADRHWRQVRVAPLPNSWTRMGG